jgi:LmbE family N-acetylglucosaminyl deacetylase
MLGVATEVLDIHDGELLPTLENRKTIVRLIREWDADVVIAPRPNDYHPDHRYTGVLVQDAAYMVAVPFLCPDTTPLDKNPVFLYFSDRFEKPNPFAADVIVGIDQVVERKIDALSVMESQFLEGGALGNAELLPRDAQHRQEREREVRNRFSSLARATAQTYAAELKAWYGDQAAKDIAYAEAFEVCEYGKQPTQAELRTLFPFFPALNAE